ncbi:MAG TPA: MBL fold metallo-hydrolase [Polyangiaceae bacterium]|nr:MBL fold metallo-hydrolase [Polyangiaceae bacterium]
MSEFRVTALGVGDTFSARHFPTCLLLSASGFNLAIDCPDSYRRVLASARQKALQVPELTDIDHVLITHVHGDHMNGLEGVAFFKRFVERKRVELVASPEVRAVIWDQRLRAPMERLFDGAEFKSLEFGDYFSYQELGWRDARELGPFRIRARPTLHHVPTSALLIEAHGKVLGYSSDTAFDPGLIEFLEPADLVLHETNYGPAHTPFAKLCGLPESLQRRMRVIHYPDEFAPGDAVLRPIEEGESLVL